MTQSICSPSSSQRRTSPVVRLAVLVAFLLGTGSPLAIHAQAARGAEPHTEAAVIADAEAWSKAEEGGDVVYVDRLLLPEYRSVNSDGSAHGKDALLGGVRKFAASPNRAARLAEMAKSRADHPYTTTAVITGDMAILTYSPDTRGPSKPVSSCDIFVYQEGHWRAIYSQHTDAGK
jgi:hypothetical protein